MKKKKLTNNYLEKQFKTKAFTLIELLAIIVILAIIAVITVPIILNVIENAKKGAAIDSAYGYKDAVDKYYVQKLVENSNLKLDGTYKINENGSLTSIQDNYEISVSGTIPSGGHLQYENNKLQSGCITIDDYKINITNGNLEKVEKGTCPEFSFTSCNNSGISSSPEEWFTFGDGAITGFNENENGWDGSTDLVIPCSFNGNSVTKIYANAFKEKNITSVIIPDSVTEIGDGAFKGTGIETVIFGTNLITIGNGAFHSENGQIGKIKRVELPDSLKTIGIGAFNWQPIESIKFGKNIETIGYSAFQHNMIKELTIPGVENLENAMFSSPNTEKVIIQNGVKSIGASFFSKYNYPSLKEISLPDTLISIGPAAFQYSPITEITIPEGVTTIGNGAFANTSITEIIIPESVTTIENGAFEYTLITEITIPANVTTIGRNALYGTNNLTIIHNHTGRSFDWNDIICPIYGTSFTPFEEGTVTTGDRTITITKD